MFAAAGAAIAWWFGYPLWAGALMGVLEAGILIILVTLLHVYRSLEKRQEIHQGKQQAYAQILHLIKPQATLPPMTHWAATPELALELIHQMMIHRPKSVVELGSGCSSLIMGYMLKQQAENGHLFSIDHDREYALKTRRDVSLHGLEAHVTVLDAPLESQSSIVLHDTHRKDETAIVHAWMKVLPDATVEWKHTDKGIAILTRSGKT